MSLAAPKRPCGSCPYRTDVASGVWAADEYEKLPGYDGEIIDQLTAGATGVFLCHQKDGNLCAGWLACHGPDNLLALRLHQNLDPSIWEYSTDVPVFKSGAEAARHGMRDIEEPGEKANRTIRGLMKKKRGA